MPGKMHVLFESPDVKSVIVSSHGMLPILEILETCQRRDVILRLLKIVNMVRIVVSAGIFVLEVLIFQ